MIRLSGTLAVASLVQLALRWGWGIRLSRGAAVALLGARICLVCWIYVLALRAAVSAGFPERGPQEVWAWLDRLAYGALIAAAGGIVISAVGAVLWLVRSIALSLTRRV